jgi:GMP synthase-like glutamine amidotransferase
MKILYVNAVVEKNSGDILKEGLLRGLLNSERAKRGEAIELVSFDMFYGKGYSPRLMGLFARNHEVDAVILSGSAKNTSDTGDPWLEDYYFGLKDLLELDANMEDWTGPKFPIFGICFGHQALACILGGETSRFSSQLGVVKVSSLPMALDHSMFGELLSERAEKSLEVIVWHSDHVVRMPRGFQKLFTSEYCSVQGMAHDQWPIVSLQSHPEITALIKNDPIDGPDFQPFQDKQMDGHHGPLILGRFVDWCESVGLTQ